MTHLNDIIQTPSYSISDLGEGYCALTSIKIGINQRLYIDVYEAATTFPTDAHKVKFVNWELDGYTIELPREVDETFWYDTRIPLQFLDRPHIHEVDEAKISREIYI